MAGLLLLAVIITVCEAARIFSSRVEYLFACRYSSSRGSWPKASSEVL